MFKRLIVRTLIALPVYALCHVTIDRQAVRRTQQGMDPMLAQGATLLAGSCLGMMVHHLTRNVGK